MRVFCFSRGVVTGILLHKAGGAIKSVQRGNGLIEGYLISFGGPADTDLEGQWFTPRTDIREDYFRDYPMLFHHGMDSAVGLDPIGRILRVDKDNVGWHAKAQLDLHDQYGRQVSELLDLYPLGWSSGSVDHLVVIADTGEILVWPLFEGTVTPTPAQSRKTSVRALKAVLTRGQTGIPRGLRARADAGIAANLESSGGTVMALSARRSTAQYVKSVLKKAGFKPTPEEEMAIAADLESSGGTVMALRARRSTVQYVKSVLKKMGFKATPEEEMAIAADLEVQDAMLSDDEFGDATLADDEFDDAMMSDDEFGDAMLSDDEFGDAMMSDDEFGDAMLSDDEFGDAMLSDDEFGDAMLSDDEFGDAMLSDDEFDPAMLSYRKSRRRTARSRQKSMTVDQSQEINAMRRRINALELQEAPGERMIGMKSLRVTRDRADQPGAYKSVFTKYIRFGEFRMNDDDRRTLRKGQVDYGAADRVTGVKALTSSTSGSVGFSVPDDFIAELNRNIMVDAVTANECKRRTTTSDTVLIPDLQTTDARRAYAGRTTWIGETAANQAETDVTPITMGQIQLPIHVLLVSTVASLSSLEDSAFDLQAYITEAFSEMIAIEHEELIWSGNGQGKMRGIVTDTRVTGSASTGVSSVSGFIASGSAASIADADKIRSLTMHLPPQYRARAKWYMNSNTANIIMQLKDANGRYLWGDEQGLNQGAPTTLLNKPIVFNEWASDVAAGAFPILLADLSRGYTIANRVEFSVRRFDDSTYAVQDNTLVLGRARMGGMVTQPIAIKALKIAVS